MKEYLIPPPLAEDSFPSMVLERIVDELFPM
jgi:hypothetical protein